MRLIRVRGSYSPGVSGTARSKLGFDVPKDTDYFILENCHLPFQPVDCPEHLSESCFEKVFIVQHAAPQ